MIRHILTDLGDEYWENKKNQSHRKDVGKMKHEIDNIGHEHWFNKENHSYHREDGGPAIIWNDGSEHWYKNDYCHRENNPVRIYVDGYEEYDPIIYWKK